MKLLKLAQKLDFKTETEYLDYCINSYFNGNYTQCRELFNAMNKKDKKILLTYINGCYDYPHPCYNFYFNLL